MRNKYFTIALTALTFCPLITQAQYYSTDRYSSRNSYGSYKSRGSGMPSYPLSCNMFGVFGGIFLTSNPDMSGYNTKKNYTDYGGGLVYDYRYEFNENSAYEIIGSGMLASCKTSHTEDGESKMKVTFPLECRFYLGFSQLKLYLGGGLQYNFIWSLKDKDGYNNRSSYYSDSEESSTGAHQLSGNGSVGLCVLGLQSRFHFLIGTKFHFPIINNAEGTENANGNKIDFSKDKTSVAATAGLSYELVRRSCLLMLNYDYPLGNNIQTSVEKGESRSFFEQHSQSITLNIMFIL